MPMSSRWNLDELESAGLRRRLAAYSRMHRLDEGTFPRTAGAPQKRVVGGKAAREADGVVVERIAHAVDALEQGERHAIDVCDRQKGLRLGLPDEGFSLVEVGLPRRQRRQPLQRPGNPLDKAPDWFLEVHGPFV